MSTRYAGSPTATVFQDDDGKKGKKKLVQLLWGDRFNLVDENWLLRLEREAFIELAQMPKTQERIAHTLTTGKPLRN